MQPKKSSKQKPFHYAVFVDGSVAGLQAFFWALARFSPDRGDLLSLNTIIVSTQQHSRYVIEEDLQDTRAHRVAKAQRLLQTYKQECERFDVRVDDIEWNILSNTSNMDVRDVILNWVEENDVSLLIMGERGLGAMAKVLLGSVTKFMLRRAPCAVAVIRSSDKKRSKK